MFAFHYLCTMRRFLCYKSNFHIPNFVNIISLLSQWPYSTEISPFNDSNPLAFIYYQQSITTVWNDYSKVANDWKKSGS